MQVDLGIEKKELQQYQNRHGGVTRDLVLKLRSREEAQRRGLWNHADSMKPYLKPGRLNQYLSSFPKEVVFLGEFFLNNVERFFQGSMRLDVAAQLKEFQSMAPGTFEATVKGKAKLLTTREAAKQTLVAKRPSHKRPAAANV